MQSVLNATKRIALLTALSLIVFSCSEDNENPINEDTTLSTTEVQTVLNTDEISGVTDEIIADIFQNGETAKSAKTIDCYETAYTDTGFTATFTDCSIEGSENVNGSISAVYEVTANSAIVTVSFTDFMVGAVRIDGTRTFSFSSEITDNITYTITSDMSITLEDGSLISESGTKTIGVVFDESFENGMFTLDGSWTIEAEGNTYVVNITDLLETMFGCDHVGKGVMTLAKNGLQVSVDFGDGSCDDLATLIYPDGTEEEFSLDD